MTFLVFLVGSLLGLCLGALLCVRFVQHGVSEDLNPKLSRMLGHLNTIEAELAYMVSARYTELNGRRPPDPRQDNP
jgi:hypothetical protein